MPNLRAAPDIYLTEIASKYATFQRLLSGTGAIDYLPTASNPYPAPLGTTTQAGQSVTMSSNDTVKVGASGDPLLGQVVRSSLDGMCSVQVSGAFKFSYIAGGSAPVLGGKVTCDGSGGVKNDTTVAARGYVTNLDATNLIATVLLSNV